MKPVYITPPYLSKIIVMMMMMIIIIVIIDRLFGVVVRVLCYRSGGLGSIPGTTRFSGGGKKERKQ
jgi:predicted neutral ceramidase superfamily lipid hydrolase